MYKTISGNTCKDWGPFELEGRVLPVLECQKVSKNRTCEGGRQGKGGREGGGGVNLLLSVYRWASKYAAQYTGSTISLSANNTMIPVTPSR